MQRTPPYKQQFHIKSGDTRPPIVAQLSAAEDDVFTSVAFRMKAVKGTVEVEGVGGIIDQPDATQGGIVQYQWITDDTADPGQYLGEFEVTFSDGRIETYPNNGFLEINVVRSLDTEDAE
jgi:hypothetical protein